MDFQLLNIENNVELDDLHYALESYGYSIDSEYNLLDFATECVIALEAEDVLRSSKLREELIKRIADAPNRSQTEKILASEYDKIMRAQGVSEDKLKAIHPRKKADKLLGSMQLDYHRYKDSETGWDSSVSDLHDAAIDKGVYGGWAKGSSDKKRRESDSRATSKSIVRHMNKNAPDYARVDMAEHYARLRQQKERDDAEHKQEFDETTRRLRDSRDVARKIADDKGKLAEHIKEGAQKGTQKRKAVIGELSDRLKIESDKNRSLEKERADLEKDRDATKERLYDAERYGDDQASRADAAELSNKRLKTGIKAGVIALAVAAAAIGGGLFLKKRREKAKARKAELTRKTYFESKGISEDKRHSYLAKIQSDAISDASKIVNKMKADKNLKASGVEIVGTKSGNTIIVIKSGSNTDVVSSAMKALRDKWVDELEAGVLTIQYTSDHTGLKIEAN